MNTSFSRIKHHTISSTGSTLFTVPLSQDFTDGTWTPTDLVESEFGIKSATGQAFVRIGNDIYQLVLTQATGTTFSGLTVAGPTGAVQFNDGGTLAGVSGFTFDQSNGDFKVVNNLGVLSMGMVDYAGFPVTGNGLTYTNPLSATTMISGVLFGDANDGNGDYACTFGYRDLAAPAARNFNAYQDRIEIISGSGSTGYDLTANSNEFVIRKNALDKIRINSAGAIIFNNDYVFPASGATSSGSTLADDGLGNLYWQKPKRYCGYFDYSSSTVTTIGVADTWYKLSASTTEAMSNDALIHTNNRITNSGATSNFKLEGMVSVEGTNNDVVSVAFFKNGSIIPQSTQQSVVTTSGGDFKASAIGFQSLIQISTGEYVEVYIKNNTNANNLTLDNLNVIITEL